MAVHPVRGELASGGASTAPAARSAWLAGAFAGGDARSILLVVAGTIGIALLELVVASRLATAHVGQAVALAVVPVALVALGALVASTRIVVAYGALAVAFMGGTVNQPQAFGGYQIYP